MSEPEQKGQQTFWILVLATLLLTRVPVMAHYLSIDNVNLAFSLEHFDPRLHQPQPPGYPLFVMFNRIANRLFHDPATTFKATGLLVTALTLPLTFALGKRMFEPWVGRAAVFLLLVTPPFWYATLEGPLRPHLALFSMLTAYCCWRCWNGEKAFATWGAIALAVGSGFRPDLGGFLFPLWLLSAWMGTRSVRTVLKGLLVMSAIVVSWLGGMAYAVGGLQNLYELNRSYIFDQSQRQSIVLGAQQHAWARQLSRLIVWNGTAVLASLWAIPVYFKTRPRIGLLSTQSVFLMTWLLPGFLFQGLIHIEDPGHTLFSVPALCLVSAYLICIGTRQLLHLRELFLGAALVFNTMLFLGFFSLPLTAEAANRSSSLKNAFVYGVFETSIGELRYQDNTAESTLAELKQFTVPNRPMLIVSNDAGVRDWFFNWRIARYYLPQTDIWVVGDLQQPHWIEHIRRNIGYETKTSNKLVIQVQPGTRIVWLLEREGPFHQALKKALPSLPGGNYLSYTDVTSDTPPFRVIDFEFIPQASH